MAVLSDHRYMRSGFAFLTDGMETQGILLALTSKSVYSHSRSVSPLMANQSTLAGKKQQFYGLQGHMWVALRSKIWSHVTPNHRLESYLSNKSTPIDFFFFFCSNSLESQQCAVSVIN